MTSELPLERDISALAERERCEKSLLYFTEKGWRAIEPKTFLSNWHLEAISEHLEAVSRGEIRRLLINMPPRHAKSLSANVFFPAWVWAQNPDPSTPENANRPSLHGMSVQPKTLRGPGVKFMHLSYDSQLSTRDSVKCRTVMRSRWYQKFWGGRVQLRIDQDTKGRFDNMQGGYRLATSENGLVTGEGGDCIIFDDPHSVRHIDQSNREETLRFWDEAMSSRLDDMQTGAYIIIMQRVHERDLSGHVLATEQGWTHVCLPAVYERKHPYPFFTKVIRRETGQQWVDPRQEGDPLWPARYPLSALQQIAKDEDMSSHVAAGQLQQRPSARDGGIFKRDWFGIVDQLPQTAIPYRVRAWDLAATADAKSDPDFTVGLMMARDVLTGVFYIVDLTRQRLSPAGVERAILNTAATDGRMVRIRLPRDPGQAGKFQVRHFVNLLAGYNVMIEPEENSKETRAESLAAQCEVGNVKLIRGSWNDTFINELCAFNKGAHDDQVDAATAAYRALSLIQTVPLQGSYGAR